MLLKRTSITSYLTYQKTLNARLLCQHNSLRAYSNQPDEKLISPYKTINSVPGLKLNISETASTRLGAIYRQTKEALQIGVESGGCHGFQYTLKLVPGEHIDQRAREDSKSSDTDRKPPRAPSNEIDDYEFDDAPPKTILYLIEEDGGKVAIDENSLSILNGCTLTYKTELIGSQFKILGGNLKSSCGCGSSFDIEI